MSFEGTQTSRRALIFGMTNTDQVGMQQAKAPAAATIPDNAERIPDAGDGADAPEAGDVNDMGLTAEEQAEFDRMAQGGDDGPDPAGDAPAAGDDEHDDDDDPDIASAPAPGAPPPAVVEKTPAQLAAEAATGQKPPPKTVSYGKYQRDLAKAQKAAADSADLAQKARDDAIKLAERVAIINEALAAPAPVAAADPNAPPANPFDEADISPTDDYAASVEQLQRRQRYQMEHQGQIEQTITESNEDRQLRDTFTRDFQTYAGTEEGKHLPAAYQFLKDARLTQICLAEFDKDPNDPNEQFTPQEVQRMVQMFNTEEKWLVGQAIKNRKSPALAIMKQAKIYGFKPAAAAAPAAPAPAAPAAPAAPRVPAVRNGNGAPPAAVPSAVETLADLAAAQAAGRSLSDGGGAPPQGLSADMLLRLNDDEFAELVDSLPKHQLDALMGRVPG